MAKKENLYFRQLLAGRQVATAEPMASQMANFMYVIGDPGSREALLVDPAWDVDGLVDQAEEDGYRLVGALGPTTTPTTSAATSSASRFRAWPGCSSGRGFRSTSTSTRPAASRW